MKTYVLTLSQTYPKGHIMELQPTLFSLKLLDGIYRQETVNPTGMAKLHTIRANYPLWATRFRSILRGEACLSVREWTGKPYASKQREIVRLTKDDSIGLQRLTFNGGDLMKPRIDFKPCEPTFVARNDGLTSSAWIDWFKNYNLFEDLAVIHFTKFRY